MEAAEQLALMRERVLKGEEVTSDEYKMVLTSVRQHRRAGKPAKASSKKMMLSSLPADLNDLFNKPVDEASSKEGQK